MTPVLEWLMTIAGWLFTAVFALLVPLFIWFGPVENFRRRFMIRVWRTNPREPGDGSCIEYHDRGRQLSFYGNDEGEFLFPDQALWERIMPPPFGDQYAKIVTHCARQGKLSFTAEHGELDYLSYQPRKSEPGPRIISLGKKLEPRWTLPSNPASGTD